MPTLLQLLSKFENVNDRENNVAYYRTHVPWEAPEAYLNIVYKPADEKTLNSVSAQLQIPGLWVRLLAQTNGAILFSAYLYIFGVVEEGTLLDRSDPVPAPSNKHRDPESWFTVGSEEIPSGWIVWPGWIADLH
jgi:hypothetical protein